MSTPLAIATIYTQSLAVDQVVVRKQTQLKRNSESKFFPPDNLIARALVKDKLLLPKDESPTIQRRPETTESNDSFGNRLPP